MDPWPEVAEVSSSVQENNPIVSKKSVESVPIEGGCGRGVHNPMAERGKSEVFAFPYRSISGVGVPRKVEERDRHVSRNNLSENIDEVTRGSRMELHR
jgi:hypothetical protein